MLVYQNRIALRRWQTSTIAVGSYLLALSSLSITSAPKAFAELGEGLILHSTFDSADISGGMPNPTDPSDDAIVADLAGFPQNGTIVDSPLVPAISIGTGIIGQAIDFPGLLKAADYPELEADETNSSRAVNYGKNFDIGTEEFTISFWFNIETANSYDQLLVTRGGNGTGNNPGWSFAQFKNSGAFRIILNDASGNDDRQITAPSGTIQDNTWTQVALTITREEDGTGTIVPYINGVNGVEGETPLFSSNSANGFTLPVGYDISVPQSVNNRPFYVGRRGTTSTPTNGLIDDLGIWNRALSDAEIQEIYANGQLGIALPAAIVPLLPGDYNGDFVVDLADYTVWRDNLGGDASALMNETVSIGTVDQEDYDTWKLNFGATQLDSISTISSVRVPEPSALLMACAGLAVMMSAHRTWNHRQIAV